MRGFMRKLCTGGLVFLTIVVGGGFASAVDPDPCAEVPPAGNCPADTSHTLTYEVLSFRAISLSSTGVVAIGYVRQGSFATKDGPTLLYATTWAGDKITVELSSDTPGESDVAGDLVLYISATTPSVSALVTCDENGVGIPGGSVVLDSTATDLITSISDCGLDSANKWVEADIDFRLDATAAIADVDYTGAQTKTVTYTIDAA